MTIRRPKLFTVITFFSLCFCLAFIVLWINSRMIYLNPLLALAGYHVYVVRLRPVGGVIDKAAVDLVLVAGLNPEIDRQAGSRE